MRNGTHTILPQTAFRLTNEETTWSLSGAFIGFFSWLGALGIPFLLYGPNTPFFFLYTWPFFLALMPVAVITGIAVHSLVGERLFYSCLGALLLVVAMFGVLFIWLMN